MTNSNEWLGISFIGTPDVQEEKKEFVLLPAGNYELTIKDVAVGQTKEKKPKVIVYFETKDGITLTKDYVVPEKDALPDDFKKLNLKNLFSRVLYNSLTREEFNAIPVEEVNKKCTNLTGLDALQKAFIGVKITANVDQVPFISKEKVTNEITGIDSYVPRYTEIDFKSAMVDATLKVKNLLKDLDSKKMPILMFKNEVMPKSIGFVNDYEDKPKKDSVSKLWYDKLATKVFAVSETTANDSDYEDDGFGN